MDSLSVNGILNGLITKVQQAKDMFRESGYSLGCWKGLQFKMCLFALRVRHGLKIIQPDAAYATAVRMYNPNTEAWDILYTELGGATQLEGKREGNRIVQTEINEKNIQWVFSEITTTSFRWQRMVKRPDGTWETEAELFAVRR